MLKTKENLAKIVFLLGFMTFWVQGDNYASAPLIVEIAREFLSPLICLSVVGLALF